MKNCLIYTRLSSKLQDQEGIASEVQRTECEIFTKGKPIYLVDWVRTVGSDEEGFRLLLDAVIRINHNDKQKIDAVLIHRLNRLSPDYNKALQFVGSLNVLNVQVYSVEENINFTEKLKEMGKL